MSEVLSTIRLAAANMGRPMPIRPDRSDYLYVHRGQARAYAGHTDSGSDAGTTTTYIRASIQEVATALATLTGEPHPLA